MSSQDFQRLERIGISGLPRQWLDDTARARIAQDAALVTTPNNGVPAWMTQYTSPKLIKVLTEKLGAEEVFDPSRMGGYGTMTATFPMIEHTGAVGAYADYGRDGHAGFNANWPSREAFYFQTIVTWGDLELAVMAQGKIDAASQKQDAAALVMKTAHNSIWFYGVQNLANWGILNDPRLNPAIPPLPNTSSDLEWADKDDQEIYADVKLLYKTLVGQNRGRVNKKTKMSLILDTDSEAELDKKSLYGESVVVSLKKAYPNMEIVSAVEMDTAAGRVAMLIAHDVMGQKTGELGYVELLKAHGVVRDLSSLRQKYSGANFGAVMYQPNAIATMIGI
ncbi:hypothetical protein ACIQVE_21380 [Pseudomonas sp. NPDC098747]|uniref:hypothetical protein n=1 Tax=Pseudomonas sp. NPDC098747 TaxID=3364487 RepID=UPI003839FC24